jgi:DNA polymerase-3 subunit epsilon|tara:strand:+ start:12451 stop:13278 length:828 start_codon:yes stop_codon:yes gene_type:complete
MDFVALDVETAIGKRWSICQIGIVVVKKDKIKEEYCFLVQPPENKYSIHNTRVHGLNSEDTIYAKTFDKIWEEIKHILHNTLIVCHNTDFDIDCIHQTLAYYNIEKPKLNYKCTYRMSKKSLEDLCNILQIDLKHHHDALEDAKACAKVYMKLQKVKETSFDDLILTNTKVDYQETDRIKGSVLKPDFAHADSNSPFYMKKVVFTGVLSNISRKEAANKVKYLGADIDHNITKRTNFIIVGRNPGPVKMKKIIKFNEEGYELEIIEELEFLEMIN